MSNPLFCLRRHLKFIVISIVFGLFTTHLYGQTNTSVVQAQTIARLYSASLDRPPFTNGLNFFINSFASGRSVISIAEDFVLSAEFVAKYGELDDVAYVERLFLNVLGRPGAQGGINFWVNNLASGQSRAFVLSEFADSEENIAKTGVLYDSMAFIDGQWQFSQVDSVVKVSCGNPGCLQTQLNGAVAGATVDITPLRDTNSVLGTVTSLDENGLRAILGSGFFNDLSDLDRLQLLGTFPPIQVASGQLYLLTTSGGMDFDNDLNQVADANPITLTGQLHAIVSAEQLAQGMQVNVMTEAAYQSMVGTFADLMDTQVSQGLDAAAAKLVTNINGDAAVDYLDVLAWSRLFDNDNIRTDLNDVNKLAVAVSGGSDGESLQILSNRMLGAAAAVGLDETSSIAINPDGTCSGRGRTIINRNQESITTSPPTATCGTGDTGRVDSTQGSVLGRITPRNNGLASNAEIRRNNADGRRNRFDFTDVDPQTGAVTITHVNNNGHERRATVPVSSMNAANNVTRRFQSLQDESIGPGSVGNSTVLAISAKVLKARRLQKEPKQPIGNDDTVGAADAESDLFTNTVTESMSYGALASNLTACLVARYVAEKVALGAAIDQDVQSWAQAGCTSALAEVDAWAGERTSSQIMSFESAIPEVQFDGCTECYSDIASPQSGTTAQVGEIITFNGVTPPTSTGVGWDFGDDTGAGNRTPSHAYDQPGTYQVTFSVDYSNGGSGESQVLVTVLEEGVVIPSQAALNVVLTWDSVTDLDLYILEPSGQEMSFENPLTSNGLTLSNDNVEGFGPEIGTLDNISGVVEDGEYTITVSCFGTLDPPPITGRVDITINAGLPNSNSARIPFSFSACGNGSGEIDVQIFVASMNLVTGTIDSAN